MLSFRFLSCFPSLALARSRSRSFSLSLSLCASVSVSFYLWSFSLGVFALQSAAECFGFFLVRNHGVSHALIDEVYSAAHEYFSQSDQEKRRVQSSDGKFGYTPWGGLAAFCKTFDAQVSSSALYCMDTFVDCDTCDCCVDGYGGDLRDKMRSWTPRSKPSTAIQKRRTPFSDPSPNLKGTTFRTRSKVKINGHPTAKSR